MNTVTLKIEEVIVLLAAVRKMTRSGANALNVPSPIVDGLGGQYEAVIDWPGRKVVLLSMEGAFTPGEQRVQHRREFDPETLTSLEVPWQSTSTNVQEDTKPSASSGSMPKGFRPPSVVPVGSGRSGS